MAEITSERERERIRERQMRLLSWGTRFFLAGALTAAQTPEGSAPFALGYISAAGAGPDGGAALAGAAAGAFLFMDFGRALPFLAVGVLIVTAATALQGTWVLGRPRSQAWTAAGLYLTVEGIYVIQSLSPLDRLGPCLAAAGLTGASAWLFRPLLQPREERPPADGLLFLGAVLLLGLGDVEILDFSPGRALLCLLLAWTAFDRGPAQGAAIGLGLGLTADLCGLHGGSFTAAFGLAGLLTGSRRGRSRGSAALLFLGAVTAAGLGGAGTLLPLLPEAASGMVLFLALPRRMVTGKRVRPETPAATTTDEAGKRWRDHLDRAAGALRDLYDSMGRGPVTDENPAIVFDRSAEKVCRGCALCELCWQREYTGTFNALNDATPFLIERGRALPKDFPQYFADRCIHLPEFIGAINGELSAFLLRRQYRRQLEETRRSARGQYAQLSELLTATAAGLSATPVMAEGPACQIGAALRPKEGEVVCGDSLASFQTDQGLWCLILADGMGSGEGARKESALVCRLLQQFLEAGVTPDAALKTLNSAMALRGAETGAFTTIDLCVFDPSAGEAAFYKFGAAPSYLKRGGVVRRVTGGALPAGLRAGVPDVTKASLEPGSYAVMVSDGVADASQDEWLMDLLAGWPGEDPQDLAGAILNESVRREKLRDDCGIQILYRPTEGAKEV